MYNYVYKLSSTEIFSKNSVSDLGRYNKQYKYFLPARGFSSEYVGSGGNDEVKFHQW